MATVAASALIAGANITATGVGSAVGAALISAGIYAAAGYLDARYVMPSLLGKGRAEAQSPRLLGVPVGSNEPGAPRIWALGRRVRVPTHILWQADKVRESSPSSSKGGAVPPQRSVLITAAVAFNDRKTVALDRLVGNGTLIIGGDRNLIQIESDSMSATESGGIVTFSMSGLDDPDFQDQFAVGDFIQCSGFVVSSGGSVNVGQMEVLTVVPHGAATPSSMTARAATGQSMSGLVATGGTAASPAVIERVDDQVLGPFAFVPGYLGVGHQVALWFTRDPRIALRYGDLIYVEGFNDVFGNPVTKTSASMPFIVGDIGPDGSNYRMVIRSSNPGVGFNGIPNVSLAPGNVPRCFLVNPLSPLSVLFPSSYDPDAYYHDGAEDQEPDSLMEANIGVGNVSAYRGVAYQVLDQFKSTAFGDSLPFQLEGVISVDEGMTWQEALILSTERGGVPRQFIDTLSVTPRPFEGFFMRGAVTGVTNLFPLLLAGQITSQERDGTICFQDTDAADVVQIENGVSFSHLGAFVGRPEQGVDKLRFSHAAREDLPTSIGIRHQDPDNAYADGYQHFGLRNPSGADHENRQEIDLSNLVLTRKHARNLVTTLIRRAWVNGTIVDTTVTANYADLLEGDLITLTDDEDNDHMARVIQRDIGTNFLVKITAAIEDLDLAVTGSPVQSAAGVPPVTIVVPPVITATLLDIPPAVDSHANTPGLYVTAAANEGGVWAGCSVWLSRDSESTWQLQGILSSQGGTGRAATVLAAAASPSEIYGGSTLAYDTLGFLYVEFDNPDAYPVANLASVGYGVENGANWFVIQEDDGTFEVFAAATVIQVDARTFILGTLLRGLRGTWAASQTAHTIGARITMLESIVDTNSTVFVPVTGPRPAGANLSFRFVPPGQTIADVQSVSIVPTWRNVAPFDPRVLTKTIGGSPFGVRFTTENWTRLNQPLGSLPPYPLDESVEAYRFTIWDPAGQSIRRTKTISAAGSGSATLRDRWVDYTSAEQIADGYTPSGSTSFYVSVQQLGAYADSRPIKRLV